MANEKNDKIASHIFFDYKAILNFVLTCLNNNLDYSSYMGIMPFFCMYIVEGYEFLCKNQIINANCFSKEDLKKLKKCRAAGVKLYSNFRETTFNSINAFNRDEYIKFYKKAFPNSDPCILSFVDNYFISFVDDCPIGNYHLYTKKVLDIDIGSYNDNVRTEIFEFSYMLTRFSFNIVKELDYSFDKNQIGNQHIEMQFKYADLNMAYDYSNFRIKQLPPILMAFLDILCTLNSYRKIFTQINDDEIFDMKIKYCILFYAVLSLKSIIQYCNNYSFDIKMDECFIKHIEDVDAQYIKNDLRKYCMHYDYSMDLFSDDPFVTKFEAFFKKNFEEISKELSLEIENLSNRLQEYLIVKNFLHKNQ